MEYLAFYQSFALGILARKLLVDELQEFFGSFDTLLFAGFFSFVFDAHIAPSTSIISPLGQ